MKTVKQPIFTRAYCEELREKLVTGETLPSYFDDGFDIPEDKILHSTLDVNNKTPEIEPDDNADLENAIKLFDYLKGLDKTQASDKRLWIYLSHVPFRSYTMKRWPIKSTLDEMKASAEAKTKATNFISERWFLSGNARSLRRHSLARLWWAANLTVAPWEKDPVYFEGTENTDRFVYTRVMFGTEDTVQQLLERRLSWSERVRFSFLEYLRRNPGASKNRELVRGTIKELNLVLGYRKIDSLSFDELVGLIEEVAASIINK